MLIPATGLLQVDLTTAIGPLPLTLSPIDCVEDIFIWMRSGNGSLHRSGQSEDSSISSGDRMPQSCVLILDGAQLVGIITQHDLVQLIASGQNLAELAIANVMSSPVITLPASELTDLFVPLDLLRRHAIGHLPILDHQGKVMGLFTLESFHPLSSSLELLHIPIAAEVMAEVRGYAASTATLAELTPLMAAKAARSVIIVDALNVSLKPIGLVTEQEIVQAFAQELDFATVQAQTVMQPVVTVRPNLPLWDVQQLMQAQQVHQVVVISEAGSPVGLINQAAVFSVLNPIALYQLAERFMQKNQAELAEHQRMEAALSTSETRYRQIAETTLEGIWMIDAENHTSYVNPRMAEILGYTADEMLGRSLFDFMDEVGQAQVLNHLEQQYRGIEDHHEFCLKTKTGQAIWVLIATNPLYDKAGSYRGSLAMLMDITKHKHTEAKLQQQANREHLTNVITQRIRASLNLQEVLHTTVAEVHQVLHSDRVLVYRLLPDGRGEVLAESVSEGWRSLAGRIFSAEIFPKENYPRYVQGRIFALSDRQTDRVLPCLAEFLSTIQVRAKLVAPILQNATLWGLLVVHQCNQARQWQTWEIDLLQYLSGQLSIAIQQSQLYAQLQDSHQQLTHINAELLRATRLKDEFLANMSHELRTPLNVILGMSESLLDGIAGTLNERQEKSIATIERSGQHLLALINDILELSKIEAGKLELDISTVAIAQLCQSSLVFIRPQAFKKQIQLNVILPQNLGEIALDERRIRQVLINLLTNAVKFTPTAGRVTLEVHREPIEVNLAERVPVTFSESWPQSPLKSNGGCLDNSYYLCISVMDTGIGIALADQTKLFQPFVQVDSSLNRQYEGTGLGLVLVKRIVELHGGDVSLCSTPGQGSCFTIRLPYSCELKEARHELCPCFSEQTPHVQVLKPERTIRPEEIDIANHEVSPLILLAEDNEASVSTMSSYLKARGFQLLVAKNGEEAIALTQTNQPALILMDIQMPVVDGLEAMRRIRQDAQTEHIPIIALTALAMEGDRERCLEAGANDYLAKPVKLKHLVATIQQLLGYCLGN